jgi:TolB-like protein
MKKIIVGIMMVLVAGVCWGQQIVVAVAPFTVNSNSVSAGDAVTITNVFSLRLAATKTVRVVTRSALEEVVQEHQFQLGDWSDDKKTASLGKALNADWVVRGTIEKLGSSIVVSAALLDVNTLEIMGGAPTQFSNINDAYNKIEPLVAEVVQTLSGQASGKKQITARPQAEYYIGDIGPAGGIIFYDKGRSTNGWRYLEAAFFETEFEAEWGANRHHFSGTSERLGTGKNNTDIIVRNLQQIGEKGKAAQLCDDLVFDGFDDWFLPSKDELNLMYKNLKSVGLGDFRDKWYWSSSVLSEYPVWAQNFSDGRQEISGAKDATACVRAVRAF